MAQNQILTYTAKLNDQATGPMRQMKAAMEDLFKAGQPLGAHRKEIAAFSKEMEYLSQRSGNLRRSSKEVQDFGRRWEEATKGFGQARETIVKQLEPAMAALGLSTVTATASLGGLLLTLRDVARTSRDMSDFGKAAGYTTEQVEGFSAAAQAFNVSGPTMLGIMKQFSTQMNLIRGTPGMGGPEGLYSRALRTPGLQGMAAQIRNIARDPMLPIAERNIRGLGLVVDRLQRVLNGPGGEVQARGIARQLGLDENVVRLAREGRVEFEKFATELNRRMGPPIDEAKLLAWEKSQARISASIEHFKKTITSGLIGDVTSLSEALGDFIDQNQQEVGDNIVKAIQQIGTAARESLPGLEDIKAVIDTIQQFNATTPGSAAQKAATGIREHGGQAVGDFLKNIPSAPLLPGVNALRGFFNAPPIDPNSLPPWPSSVPGARPRGPWSGGRPSGLDTGLSPATSPQRFSGGAPEFAPGSLGYGDITQGMRRSTNVEDGRSPEQILSDDQAFRGQEESTRAEQENTEELRRLNDLLKEKGFGGGGPMFRPGIGPGASVSSGPGGGTITSHPGPGGGGGGGGRTTSGGGRHGHTNAPSIPPPPSNKFSKTPMPSGATPGGFTGSALPPGSTVHEGGFAKGGWAGEQGEEFIRVGERERELVVPESQIRWSRYLAGIGYLETSLDPKEQTRTRGVSGYFQFKPGTAALNTQKGFADPRAGSLQEQAAATQKWIEAQRPAAAAAISSGDFAAATNMLRGTWVSLPGGSEPQSAARYKEYQSILAGTSEFNKKLPAGATQQAGPDFSLLKTRKETIETNPEMFSPEKTKGPSSGLQIQNLQGITADAFGQFGPGGPSSFVVHHTGGNEPSAKAVAGVLRSRTEFGPQGLATQFVIDKEGVAHQLEATGARGAHVMPPGVYRGKSRTPFPSDDPRSQVSNATAVGVEVIGKSDAAWNEKQRQAIVDLYYNQKQQWGWQGDPVWGHSDINPGHRENEGSVIAQQIREGKLQPSVATPMTTLKVKPATGSAVAFEGGMEAGGYSGAFAPDSMNQLVPRNIAPSRARKGVGLPSGTQLFSPGTPPPQAQQPSPVVQTAPGGQRTWMSQPDTESLGGAPKLVPRGGPPGGKQDRSWMPAPDVGALGGAHSAGSIGGGANADVLHKVEGTGHIRVDVKGPKGVKVDAEAGGLFKRVELNRGAQMQSADEVGTHK